MTCGPTRFRLRNRLTTVRKTGPKDFESTPNMASNAIYVEAINQAIIEEMKRDESVFIMGEDIRRSVYGATAGLVGPVRRGTACSTRRCRKTGSSALRWEPPW